MCASCSENGTQTQCPTCRQLMGDGFPYDANADVGTLLSYSWDAFKREWAMLLAALAIAGVMIAGGGIIANIFSAIVGTVFSIKVDPLNPFSDLGLFFKNSLMQQVVGTLVGLPVQAVALVGLFRVLLDVLMGRKADIGRMFTQLHLVPRYVVAHLVLLSVTTVPMFVGLAVLGSRLTGALADGADPMKAILKLFVLMGPGLIGLSIFIFVVSIVVLPMSLYATAELVVSDCTGMEALQRTWHLGSGQRLRLIGYSFVAGLMVIAGVLACCVGVLAAFPLAELLVLSLFLALRKSSTLPPATKL